MSTVDDRMDERIEAALAALVAEVPNVYDVTTARQLVATRAAEVQRPPVSDAVDGRRWWLAAAAALVVIVGVVGIVTLRSDGTDDPVSPTPSSVPTAPTGPLVPERVAVLGPDAGQGSPTRPNPYLEWVSEHVAPPSVSYQRADGPGTISYIYGTDVAGPGDVDETIVDLGDGVVGRRGAFTDVDGQYLIWSSGDVVYMVSWTSTVAEAEALEFVRSAIDDPAAPQPPDGMVAMSYPQPVESSTVFYGNGDALVGSARYPAGQRPAAADFAGTAESEVSTNGGVVVTEGDFGTLAVRELDDTSIVYVSSATDADVASLVADVELVPAVDVPYADWLDEHPVPTDADVVFGGDEPPMRWALATWTADDGLHCLALMAGTNLTPRCDAAPVPMCLALTGGTTSGETRYFVLAEGSPTRVAATFNDANSDDYYDDGREFVPELVSADSGYTFASGALDDSMAVASVTVDGDACTLL